MDTSSRSAAGSAAAIPGASRPLRIFVVENHEDTRFLLVLLLEQLGHTVFSATSLGAALAELPPARCDVLISDIGLPDGNGWELMTRLGDQRPRYAVAMSGFGMSSDRQCSLGVGYRTTRAGTSSSASLAAVEPAPASLNASPVI